MTSPYAGRTFVFDLETNGLLDAVTRVHCAVAIDVETEEVLDFKPNEIGKFLELYTTPGITWVGHNIIGYDYQVIEKIYGIKPPPISLTIDTVQLARLVFSDQKNEDVRVAARWKKHLIAKKKWDDNEGYRISREEEAGLDPVPAAPYPKKGPKEFPGYLCGVHSLEAWGYRLGTERKGDYAKEMKAKGLDPWAEWNPDMHDYMIQDGRVNVALFKHLMAQMPTPQSVLLEMRVQDLCSGMERNGWPFAEQKAQELYMRLCAERDALQSSLRELFPPWTIQLPDFIPKRNNKTKGYVKGVPVERFETIEFNPASRDHIADRLKNKYGWEPEDYTSSGKPKIDDDVLNALPYPEAKALARFFMIQKRIGQLGEGKKAWLKLVKNGKIHGRYNTNGTVSGRASHLDPNVGQVPATGVEFGRDCRELFTVMPGFKQVGADQSGLELRCLGSFMAAFDGGAYIKTVLYGDVHWENAKALFGLPMDTERYAGVDDDGHGIEIPEHEAYRKVAKTFIYAFLYGSGDMNLGYLAGVSDEEAQAWKADPEMLAKYLDMRKQLFQRAAKYGDPPPNKQQLRWAFKGLLLRERFMAQFPALAKLIKFVKGAAKKGWLKGLDGRVLPVRSPHAALNVLLQSAGAVICKQWIVDANDALLAAGLKHGWDGDYVFLGWIHDELQIAVREGLEDQVSTIVVDCARKAGDPFPQWRCPLDGEAKVGDNWADCH